MKAKAIFAALLMFFAAAAVADEAADARIAELEARIESLEMQIQRLTALLQAATRERGAAAESGIAAGDERNTAAARQARANVDTPPLVVITPQETIRNEIRFECMQRQTYEHAIGGAAPNYSSC